MKKLAVLCALLVVCASAAAKKPAEAAKPKPKATVAAPIAPATAVVPLTVIQVTATKEPEAVDDVPASISVVSGEELRARGANDLRTALALVGGVEGTPTGDAGPAGSVPALWGLREVDAFLLVVDGVPLGGAFNPITPQVDLTGVERIEIIRGATPVSYGATSFNGVIHIIHYAPGKAPATLTAGGGSFGSFGVSGSVGLPTVGDYTQSLTANIEKRGFSTARQDFNRYHFLYRGGVRTETGGFHADVDVSVLPQTPGNVIYRRGAVFNPDNIPIDSNANPSDARLNQDRLQVNLGWDSKTSRGQWSTTLSLAKTHDDNIRGFLKNDGSGDADGFAQKRDITDVYFDSHLLFPIAPNARVTTGVDLLLGNGEQTANNFAYKPGLDGSTTSPSTANPVDEIAILTNKRIFTGVYGQVDWAALPDVDVLAGLRLNITNERAHGQEIDIAGAHAGDKAGDGSLTRVRPSGVIGVSWHVWRDGANHLTLYGDYRNTYKPLATDFGPEAEFAILKPETSSSYEVGAKGEAFDGCVHYDASVFQLDFNNLKTNNDTMMIVNAGKTRFTGVETEARFEIARDFQAAANYAYHDSRFLVFNRNGTPGGNVAGNRLEFAPYHLAGLGLLYTPAQGFNATLTGNYTGERQLNKSNSLSKEGFVTLDASVGYHVRGFGVNLSAYNLTDRREPIAESELADAVFGAPSYYLMPARSLFASITVPLE